MTRRHAVRQMMELKEVTRQFPQGLVSGQILSNISNKDLGIKVRSVIMKLADTYRKHLQCTAVLEPCTLTWGDLEHQKDRNGYSRRQAKDTHHGANGMNLFQDLSGGKGHLGEHLLLQEIKRGWVFQQSKMTALIGMEWLSPIGLSQRRLLGSEKN